MVREIIDVNTENNIKQINTFCGHYGELMIVKADGTHSHHWALECNRRNQKNYVTGCKNFKSNPKTLMPWVPLNHVKWISCHHGMARPRVADGEGSQPPDMEGNCECTE
jgi:hypothetical protein